MRTWAIWSKNEKEKLNTKYLKYNREGSINANIILQVFLASLIYKMGFQLIYGKINITFTQTRDRPKL